MSRRVLLTGASGFVGRAVLPALRAAGCEVVPLARAAGPAFVICDLEDPEATRRIVRETVPTDVVHLAGGTAPTSEQLYLRNVLTTVHVLEASAELSQPPRCVVLGSAAEYGETEGELTEESAPLRPVTDYGRAKAAQSELARAIAGSRGLPLTILRPFNLVARELSEATALGRMRRELLAASGPERRLRCGRLDVVRDFVPLSTLVSALVRLCTGVAPGGTVNVCSGVGIPLSAVLEAMASRLGAVVRVDEDPELCRIPAARRVVGDPARLRSLIGDLEPVSPQSLAALMVG